MKKATIALALATTLVLATAPASFAAGGSQKATSAHSTTVLTGAKAGSHSGSATTTAAKTKAKKAKVAKATKKGTKAKVAKAKANKKPKK